MKVKKSLQPINIIRPITITVVLLLIPLLAMNFNWQFTDPGRPRPETIDWNLFDFIVMGTLIMLTSVAYEVISLRLKTSTNKIALAIVLLILFLLIWAEMAVGIFGSPIAGS